MKLKANQEFQVKQMQIKLDEQASEITALKIAGDELTSVKAALECANEALVDAEKQRIVASNPNLLLAQQLKETQERNNALGKENQKI